MSKKWLVVLWLGLGATAAVAADRVDRIEPASWWIGMQQDRLQLMAHGDRIAELTPALQYPGVVIEGVERVENPNYLFINLRIAPDTRPGSFRLEFRRGRTTVARRTYVLNAREPGSAHRAGFGPADAIYLVVPDRYANGDPANDSVPGMADRSNRGDSTGRHGGDLQGIVDHLDYIADLGFTQLWLTPVLENDQPATSYHGYATTDFYRVDARMGTNELYRRLAVEARKRGVGLIMDIVLNHCGSGHWWMRDPPSRDWFNHEGRFVGTSHVHEAVQDPHGTEEDRRAFNDGWFVPTMPDLNQRNPQLATYLIQNSLWWIEYAGLSGLRIDTYPYVDRGFLSAWSRRVTEEYPRLNVVGEEWNSSPAMVSYWQRGRVHADGYVSYLPSLFDFPLADAVALGLRAGEDPTTGLMRIYRVLASDGLYADPYDLVVLLDNHDMGRILTRFDERADLQRIALTFLLTTRGTPQVLYGTEVLMSNRGSTADGVIRSDFPGGWPGDTRNAFNGQGLTAGERDAQDYLRRLLTWRRTAPAVQSGTLTQYVPQDGVYVYFRATEAQKLMVILNASDSERTVETRRFHEMTGSSQSGTDVLSGRAHRLDQGVPVAARSATVLELN